ncbi:MAG: substrate-binding domain-containing protein [Alphaproteobacteria bacterium]|nr:substrate-binding domain-containing protein [Alphaproteobacteria bacterium]
MSARRFGWLKGLAFGTALSAAAAFGLGADHAEAKTKDGKYLIYYSMSYVGNAWQTEAKNAVTAMSKTAAYKDRVELRTQAAGANAQKQIQQMNAMIQAGADAILAFPISPTALNGVIKNACEKGVVVVVINGVTEPCAYVVKVDGVKLGAERTEWVIKQLGGKGNIVAITGVPGVSYNEEHHQGFKETVAKYPDIKVIGELVGMWDQSLARVKMKEFLATHKWEDIDGIVAQTGCYTLSLMQVEDGYYPKNPVIPCSGESSNGGRLQMLPPDSNVEGALGRAGLSSGSGLWAVAYLLKVAVDVLDGKKPASNPIFYNDAIVHVTKDNVKICESGTAAEFAAGCNTIAPGIVPPDYAIDFWSPNTPELGFSSALLGEPDY